MTKTEYAARLRTGQAEREWILPCVGAGLAAAQVAQGSERAQEEEHARADGEDGERDGANQHDVPPGFQGAKRLLPRQHPDAAEARDPHQRGELDHLGEKPQLLGPPVTGHDMSLTETE